MECSICLDNYSTERPPKVLPCGHSACLQCLRQLDKCPECRREFFGPAEELTTNFALMSAQDRGSDGDAAGPSGWWCTECRAMSSARCRRHHLVLRVREALRRRAERLADPVTGAAQSLAVVVQAAPEESARLALQLLTVANGDAPAECELIMRQGGSAVGARWKLEDGGIADGVDLALICKLASEGRLRKTEFEAPRLPAEAESDQESGQEPDPESESELEFTDAENADREECSLTFSDVETSDLEDCSLNFSDDSSEPGEPGDPAMVGADGDWLPDLEVVNMDVVGDEVIVGPDVMDDDVIIPELDVGRLSLSEPAQNLEEKQDVLERVRRNGVRRLVNVYCDEDWAWSLRLLRAAAARLEELEVMYIREAHLLEVHAAPRLRRLYVDSDRVLDAQPPQLDGDARCRLEWLRVDRFPRATLESLLRAHGSSLRTLVLWVGTPCDAAQDWPDACDDLDVLLGRCGLGPALRQLVLMRPFTHCDAARCADQKKAVSRVLPYTDVICESCNRVPAEAF